MTEDACILACLSRFGKQWKRMWISGLFPYRTYGEITNRGTHLIKTMPRILTGEHAKRCAGGDCWDSDEDKLLKEAYRKHLTTKHKFEVIAKSFEKRTGNAVRKRIEKLRASWGIRAVRTKKRKKKKRKKNKKKPRVVFPPDDTAIELLQQNPKRGLSYERYEM